MAFADEVQQMLKTPPYEDAPVAPEAARNEAAAAVKRAQRAYDQDPRGTGPSQALPIYLDALDLDPSCKLAYEGIGKLVLGKATDSQPAVEAALRFVEVGTKRLPQDTELREVAKRLRSLLPAPPAERALGAKTSSRNVKAPSARVSTGKPQARCEYCKSPIPLGSESCRSCEMSGELARPAGVKDARSVAPVGVIVTVLVGLVLIGGALAAFIMKR